MSELSREDIRHLSHLARLELSEEEYARYSTQLTQVVGYVEQLKEISTESVTALRGVTGMENVFGEDVPRPSTDACAVDTAALLKEAPLHSGQYLEVRAVLDEGEAS